MTPEGKVKHDIKKMLRSFGAWYYMPVPGGYGAPSLDFICSYHSVTFAIEAKAPGKQPTLRQDATMTDMENAGIRTFVIDGDLAELEAWLYLVKERVPVIKKLLGSGQTLEQALYEAK